jgi:hypothetical protein
VVEAVAALPLAPQVALTVKVPGVHAEFPPDEEVNMYEPDEGSAYTSATSAIAFAELVIVMTTPVLEPGAGETVPEIVMDWFTA